jgi:hypothetical protein
MILDPVYEIHEKDIYNAMPYLERALAYTKWGPNSLCWAMRRGQVLLILCRDNDYQIIGAGVGAVEVALDGNRSFVVHLFSADSDSGWMDFYEPLTAMALGMGCKDIKGSGRPGWARKLGARIEYNWVKDLWLGSL